MRAGLLALLLACGGPSAEDSGPTTGTPAGTTAGLQATARSSDHVESVMVVSWDPGADGTHHVAFGTSAQALDHQTEPVQGAEPTIPVLGLAAGTTVWWQAVSQVGSQTLRSEPASWVVPSPSRFPPVAVDGSSIMDGGYLMGAVSNGLGVPNAVTSVGIWRVSDGAVVWWRDLPNGWWTVSPSVSMDGLELLVDAYPQAGLFDADAELIAVALDGSSLHQDTLEAGHHAAVQTGPERWAWISASFHPDGPYDGLTDRVLEGERGATDPATPLWDLHAELGGVNPENCVHNQQVTPLVPGGNTRDWAHTNSLVYVSEQDALYAYSRYLDTLWRIDRAAATVDWRLGGPESDFTGADALWSHAHLSDLWADGALVFDNGDHYQPPTSSVVEIAWDETTMEASEVWRYTPDPERYVGILGDARKLSEDRVLVVLTTEGLLQEVDRSGTVQWTAQAPDDLKLSRVRYLPSLPGRAE